MAAAVVSRENVIGHRIVSLGLDRRPGGVDGVLRLGIQDTPHGSARAAWVARSADHGPLPGSGLETVWSWRGAPHLHRADDLADLAQALWPLSDADATARISSSAIKVGARRGIEAFTVAAVAMREAVTGRMPKGEVSAAVSAAVPTDLTFDCSTCQCRHVSGGLLQSVGLAAGVRVVVEGNRTFLEPLPPPIRPASVPTAALGTAAALRRYVGLFAPTTAAHLASFLGTGATPVKGALPEGLVEVDGPGGRGLVAHEDLDDLRAAEIPRLVRLLPAGDPWLQGRDREVIVPDAALRKQVWKAISSPGVVLVDGEVIGLWRAKVARRRLLVTVTSLAPLSGRLRAQIDEDAARLAPQRGVAEADVEFAT